jgi:hypothetical protein
MTTITRLTIAAGLLAPAAPTARAREALALRTTDRAHGLHPSRHHVGG